MQPDWQIRHEWLQTVARFRTKKNSRLAHLITVQIENVQNGGPYRSENMSYCETNHSHLKGVKGPCVAHAILMQYVVYLLFLSKNLYSLYQSVALYLRKGQLFQNWTEMCVFVLIIW